MSQRDRDLLAATEMSVSDVAKLFGKSRQAIYQALSSPKHYFSSEHIALLTRAVSHDAARVAALNKFVTQYIHAENAKLLVPGIVERKALEDALLQTDRIILGCNGDLSQLEPTTDLGIIVKLLCDERSGKMSLFYGEAEVLEQLKHGLKVILPEKCLYEASIANYPSFVAFNNKGSVHAYCFMRNKIEETTARDATKMWEFFVTKTYPKSDSSSVEAA